MLNFVLRNLFDVLYLFSEFFAHHANQLTFLLQALVE